MCCKGTIRRPAVLRISVIGTPNSLAADLDADLVLCALNTEMSIPDKDNTVFST